VAVLVIAPAGAAHAQRGDDDRSSGGGGSGGVRIGGADQSDRHGGILIAVRVKSSRITKVLYRLAYNFYPRSKRLCGRFMGSREQALFEDNASWHRPITARVSHGRFSWNRRYPRTAFEGSKQRRTHMTIKARGRLTGPKTGILKIVYSAVTYRGDACKKTFHVKLSTKRIPPPPRFKTVPDGRWTATRTIGDPSGDQYKVEDIEFRRTGYQLEVEVGYDWVCGSDPHFIIGEPPIKRRNTGGTGFEQPVANRVAGSADNGLGGTISLDATYSGGVWKGVVTWDIPDNPYETCRGEYKGRWEFTTGSRRPPR
jgi:hypothetical protein